MGRNALLAHKLAVGKHIRDGGAARLLHAAKRSLLQSGDAALDALHILLILGSAHGDMHSHKSHELYSLISGQRRYFVGHSVYEIAERCGFSSSNYFGDVFRRRQGVPPSQYRKAQRHQNPS